MRKARATRQDSESNKNSRPPLIAKNSTGHGAEHLQEELALIGALIRFFLEKTGAEAGEEQPELRRSVYF